MTTGSDWPRRISRAVYSQLLRLYPSSYRDAGQELMTGFDDRWQLEQARGGLASLRVWMVILLDVTRTLPRAWLKSAGGGRRRLHGSGALQGLVLDLRVARRNLMKRPVALLVMVATLAVVIGTNVALFSIVDRLMLRPFPIEGGDRLRFLSLRHEQMGFQLVPGSEDIRVWRDMATTLESVEEFEIREVAFGGDDGQARLVRFGAFTPGMFRILRIVPLEGWLFSEGDGELGSAGTVMVSPEFWRSEYDGDPGIVGQQVRLDDNEYEVIGVANWLPPLGPARRADFVRVTGYETESDMGRWVMAQLAPGIHDEVALAEITSLLSDTLEVGSGGGFVPHVVPANGFSKRPARYVLTVGSVVFLLLILSVANVSGAMLSNLVVRSNEISVRMALGSGRFRVSRMLAVEGMLMLGMAGILGVVVGYAVHRGIDLLRPESLWALESASMGPMSVLMAVALGLICGLVAGLIPVLRLTSNINADRLRSGARAGYDATGNRIRSTLVGVQVALSMIVILGAGLLSRGLISELSRSPGFTPEGLVIMKLRPPETRYDEAAAITFMENLRDRLEAIPAVSSVSMTSGVPTQFGLLLTPPTLDDGTPMSDGPIEFTGVDVDYFRTVGTRIVAGRAFDESDRPTGDGADGASPVVIDAQTANRFLPDGAVGETIFVSGTPRVVVGVAETVRTPGSLSGSRMQMYVPASSQRALGSTDVAVRYPPEDNTVQATMRSIVRELDPFIPIRSLETGTEMLEEHVSAERFTSLVVGAMGAIALLLSAIGLYGMVSLNVVSRIPEIGVRMALGASAARMFRSVTAAGMKPVVIGVVVGAMVGVAAARFGSSLLYGIPPWDPAALGVAAGILALIGVIATVAPALRAARIDPVRALRNE